MINLGKVALVGGELVVSAALLSACGGSDEKPRARRNPPSGGGPTARRAQPQRDPARAARDLFRPYDRNRQGGISAGEAVRHLRGGSITGPRHFVRRDGDFNVYRHRVGYERITRSIRPTVRAADRAGDGNGSASWKELGKLADRNHSGRLDDAELRRLRSVHGEQFASRENVWTGYQTFRIDRTPYPGTTDPFPDTADGDDPIWTPPFDTGPGDDVLTGPRDDQSGDTADGDDGGGGGGPAPSRPSPHSTDNGNPDPSKF